MTRRKVTQPTTNIWTKSVVRLDRSAPFRSVGGLLRAPDAPSTTRAARFSEFVATHERRLRQALTAACGASAGREAAADALAYAWEHWDRVADMENPAGYLFVVARNRSRRSAAAHRRSVVFASASSGGEPWCEPALAGLLSRLPERERVVVLLLHAFQWSMSETAELLGVSKSTVQTHAERGMGRLRAGLGVTL